MTESEPPADNPYRATRVENLAAAEFSTQSGERMEEELDPYGGEWDLIVRLFVCGERFYGQCDEVPGTLHVLTRFFHLWWFPLIPRESWLILIDRHGCRSAGHVRLRLQPRSIALTWLRALLWVAVAVLGCAGVGGLLLVVLERRTLTEPLVLIALAVGAFLLLRLTQWGCRAAPVRRLALLQLAGFPEGDAQWIADSADRGELDSTGLASVKCRHCGRELAPTTRVCPRCEQRVGD